MSPGAAADVLRQILANKGSCKGIDGNLCYAAIDAAPVGTTVICSSGAQGNFRMVKLSDGWGRRMASSGPNAPKDSRGYTLSGTPLIHTDHPLQLRSPPGTLHWDTICLPADAPTGAPEVLLRAFLAHLGLSAPNATIEAFLATYDAK
jgi:hypothetical protein